MNPKNVGVRSKPRCLKVGRTMKRNNDDEMSRGYDDKKSKVR